ncbi:MAG: formylglycine-generating enzyme family protein, partial [Verrucomicrobiota bacterium]
KAARERLWEPLRLAAGFLVVPHNASRDSFRGSRPGTSDYPPRAASPARELLRMLVGSQDWADVWLAGELWLELDLPKELPDAWKKLKGSLQGRLVELIQRGGLVPFERAAAGRALGHVGDPRRGVAPLMPPTPDRAFLDWCEVPPTKDFQQGGDPGAYGGEQGIRHASLPRFWMARYPVTNAQYDGFEASDYFRRHALPRRDQSDARFLAPNQPAVNVSWHEAWHFCRWLTEAVHAGTVSLRDGQGAIDHPLSWAGLGLPAELDQAPKNWRLTLPPEALWERAARQTDGRIVPWRAGGDHSPLSDEELTQHGNWIGTGIGSTSAVGLFPNPAPPDLALDLIGNVWEWTATRWTTRPLALHSQWASEDADLHSKDQRVLRGGSWGAPFYPDGLRAAFRNRLGPVARGRVLFFERVFWWIIGRF